MNNIFPSIQEKKEVLDAYRRFQPAVNAQFEEWSKQEYVYSSNLIEGGSLSRAETNQVIGEGLTIGGKTLAEQNNLVATAEAVDWIRRSASLSRFDIDEQVVISLHHLPTAAQGDAGLLKYTYQVPYVLTEFTEWLRSQKDTEVEVAVAAFLKLLEVRPFKDHNARTARLLFDLLLLMDGYPLVVIPEASIEQYSDGLAALNESGDSEKLRDVLYQSIVFSLNACLAGIEQKPMTEFQRLWKIGQLAAATNETIPTIRHWTKEGLLQVAAYSEGGYQLYDPAIAQTVIVIRQLQREKRMTIREIRDVMEKELVVGNEGDK